MINIAQMHDMYNEIFQDAQTILKTDPKDVHALFVKALYTICEIQVHSMTNEKLNESLHTAESTQEWKDLNESSPFFADVLSRVAIDASTAWDSEFSPSGVVPLKKALADNYAGELVIGVFGWGPIKWNDELGWTALPPMQERIDAAAKLAEKFKTAHIIASGGAVTSGMAEGTFILQALTERSPSLGSRIIVDKNARDSQGNAEFIATWIQDNIKDHVTLFIVGSDWQDPRFRAIVGGVFETKGINATLVPVGAGMAFNNGADDPRTDGQLAARIKVEQKAIYRDLARARGFFEYCDFQPNRTRVLSLFHTSCLSSLN